MELQREQIGEILASGSEAEQDANERKVRRSFFSTLKRAARHLPFVEDVVASYYCALDARTPARTRGILLAALAYFVLPFDVIPDFVIGLGYTDDAAVLLAAFTAVQRDIRPRHYHKARSALGGKRDAKEEDDSAAQAAGPS